MTQQGTESSEHTRRDFRRDIAEFDGKPVTEVTGEDRHAAEVLKFNGYLSLGFRNGVIVFLKTRKADRTLELM